MKKLFALMLALSLALTMFCAGAETIEARSGAFTLEVPDGYVRLTPEMAKALLTDADTVDAFGELISAEASDELQAVLAQIDFDTMEMVYTPDMQGNLNVQLVDGGGLTPSFIPMIVKQLDALLIPQYVQLGYIPGEDYAQSHGAVTCGDNTFYMLYLNVAGVMDTYVCITFSEEGSTQATLTFVGISMEEMENILSSFHFLVK